MFIYVINFSCGQNMYTLIREQQTVPGKWQEYTLTSVSYEAFKIDL